MRSNLYPTNIKGNTSLMALRTGNITQLWNCLEHEDNIKLMEQQLGLSYFQIAIELRYYHIAYLLVHLGSSLYDLDNMDGEQTTLKRYYEGYLENKGMYLFEALSSLAQCDRIAYFTELLDYGFKNESDAYSNTLVYKAASYGSMKILQILISENADIHQKNQFGIPPIDIAYANDNVEVVEYLKTRGATPNLSWNVHLKLDDDEVITITPDKLKLSNYILSTNLVKFWVDIGFPIRAIDILPILEMDTSTLRYVLQKSNLPIAYLKLLEHSIKLELFDQATFLIGVCLNSLTINQIDSYFKAALNKKSAPLLQWLLKILPQSTLTFQPLTNYFRDSLDFEDDKIAKVFISYFTHIESLRILCRKGHLPLVEYVLLNCKKEIESSESFDKLLFDSIHYTETSIMSLLIEHGADMNCTNQLTSRTPLHMAAYRNRLKVVELLTSKGVNLNPIDYNENTPLHLAINRKNEAIARYLVENGADITALNSMKNSCLLLAVLTENFSLINFFLKNGSPLNAINIYGENALSLAIKQDNYKLFKLLATNGVNIHHMHDKDCSLLHYTLNFLEFD